MFLVFDLLSLLILRNKYYLLLFSLAFAFCFDHSDWFIVCVWFDHRWRKWNIISVKNMLNICALELDQFGLVFVTFNP